MEDATEALMTPREVAIYLGMHEETIREALREGRLPGVRLGRSWRVPARLLNEWIGRRAQSGERSVTNTNLGMAQKG
ncbi:MAG: helix-turn-helix domain-containing protein [Planctomycetes bacterium]|nr:helix-turn-helix domain-containing protein [Planctomycetota bacterium]